MFLGRTGTLRTLGLFISLTLILPPFVAEANAAGSSPPQAKKKTQAAKKKTGARNSSRASRAPARSKRPAARKSTPAKRRATANRRPASRRGGSSVRTTPVYSRSPIHNSLTEAWATAGGQTVLRNRSVSDGTGSSPREWPELNGALNNAPDQQPVPNPVFQAYAESLAARGFGPDNQGFIVTTMSGEVVAEHNAYRPFNPASVVKVATSLAAISRLGPDFRFRTSIYTDGLFDPETGTLNGSIYVVGSGDPAFFYENALLIADKLNRQGIRTVSGNLVVLGRFYFNFSESRDSSARAFRNTLTPETWSQGARLAYPRFQVMRSADDLASTEAGGRRVTRQVSEPSLKIEGETVTDPWVDTSKLHLLAVHTSLPLVRVLKGLNDFSNNWMAHVIGGMVGGPAAVQRFLETEVGLSSEELSIVTSSGLGSNQISPYATIQLFRKLANHLEKEGLGLADILPVAGVDQGTLERRYTDAYRGSVVGKTGTLRSVSALAGVAHTRNRGPLLFVIYNRGGAVNSFRAAQDETVKKIIALFGGPVSARYDPRGEPQVSERAGSDEENVGPGSQR